MFGLVKKERHILVKFFGIKLSLNYPINWKLINKFKNHTVNKNTILIVEINPTHKETITGLCHYLKELNYNFEILVNSPSENLFSIFSNVKVWEFKRNSLLKLLKVADFSKYERIIYNSKIIYQNGEKDLHEFLKKIPQGKRENIYLQHHIDRYFEYPSDKQIILANPAKDERLEKSVVNAHYFGNVKITPKNDITTFITIGELSQKRKNCDSLINSVKQLVEQGIHNFKVEVIGNGSLEIPENIQQYFDIKGRLDFPQMFEIIENADYFLPLLDPTVEEHKRYMQDGTSGTFQLVYGFLKPCLIHKAFADIYNFDERNSLIYEQNQDIVNSMIKAINMKQEEYINLQNNLKEKVKKIENQSLENLSNILKKFDNNYNKYDIISLGEDCMVRRYLTRGGLKKRKAEGELSCPFDLSFTTVESIIKILEKDFSDYFEDLEFSVEDNYWINKKYNIGYNHDLDCRENDKNKLINRFKDRIENFRKIVRTSPYIYFVCKTRCSKETVLSLAELLKSIRQNLPFKLLILDINKKIPIVKKDGIKIIKIKHPFKTRFDWWQDIDSHRSIIFQSKICNAVENEISKDFTVNHYLSEDVNFYDGNY